MKLLKNKLFIFLLLSSVTGQVFAMGAMLPNLGNISTILSVFGKKPVTTPKMTSIINQVSGALGQIKK